MRYSEIRQGYSEIRGLSQLSTFNSWQAKRAKDTISQLSTFHSILQSPCTLVEADGAPNSAAHFAAEGRGVRLARHCRDTCGRELIAESKRLTGVPHPWA